MKVKYLMISVIFALAGCDVVTSPAKPEKTNFACVSDFGFINDEPDAGVTIKVTVTNDGEAGKIMVTPKLSTSEGEWSRNQTLFFDAGESKNLSYFFYEPTINATNINCSVKTIP